MGWNDETDEPNPDLHGVDDSGTPPIDLTKDLPPSTPKQKASRYADQKRAKDRRQQEMLVEAGFDPLDNDKAKNGAWKYHICYSCQKSLLTHRFPKSKTKWAKPVCTTCIVATKSEIERSRSQAPDTSATLELPDGLDITKDLPSVKMGAEIYGKMGYWALSRITEQKLEKATAPQLVNMARECHEMQQLLGGKPTAIVGLTRAKKIEELLPALSEELDRRRRLKVVN